MYLVDVILPPKVTTIMIKNLIIGIKYVQSL